MTSNCHFTDHYAGVESVNIWNVKFAECRAPGEFDNGGGLRIGAYTTCSIILSTFFNCTAYSGGGVYLLYADEQNSVLKMTSNTFDACQSYSGSAAEIGTGYSATDGEYNCTLVCNCVATAWSTYCLIGPHYLEATNISDNTCLENSAYGSAYDATINGVASEWAAHARYCRFTRNDGTSPFRVYQSSGAETFTTACVFINNGETATNFLLLQGSGSLAYHYFTECFFSNNSLGYIPNTGDKFRFHSCYLDDIGNTGEIFLSNPIEDPPSFGFMCFYSLFFTHNLAATLQLPFYYIILVVCGDFSIPISVKS